MFGCQKLSFDWTSKDCDVCLKEKLGKSTVLMWNIPTHIHTFLVFENVTCVYKNQL